MSYLLKDNQQEQSLGHGYTHKKFNRIYAHKKLGLCWRQRDYGSNETELQQVITNTITVKALFRPYALGAHTPRKRRVLRQSSFDSSETNTPQLSPLAFETGNENCAYPPQSSQGSCESTGIISASSLHTSQPLSPFCDLAESTQTLSIYTPQPSSSSHESAKENYNSFMYTPQSSPLSYGSNEDISMSSQSSPQAPPTPQYSPQYSETLKENFTPSGCSSQSSPVSCKSASSSSPPKPYDHHLQPSSAPNAAASPNETCNMPAESPNSYVLRLQRQRAALYMRYLSQLQHLPAISLQTPTGYPIGYPNVTAPIFNGY